MDFSHKIDCFPSKQKQRSNLQQELALCDSTLSPCSKIKLSLSCSYFQKNTNMIRVASKLQSDCNMSLQLLFFVCVYFTFFQFYQYLCLWISMFLYILVNHIKTYILLKRSCHFLFPGGGTSLRRRQWLLLAKNCKIPFLTVFGISCMFSERIFGHHNFAQLLSVSLGLSEIKLFILWFVILVALKVITGLEQIKSW